MPQIINVPGTGPVQFPDGMSDADIIKAIRGMAPQQTGAQKLAKETGAGESFLVSAGKKTDSILDGLTQMLLKARGETSALGGLAQNVAEKKALYDPLAEAHPIATGVGEALPSVAGGVVGGVLPELLSYGSAEERLKRAGVALAGSAAGKVVGKVVGRALKPSGAGMPAIAPEAQAAAERLGYKLSAGEVSQNPAMLALENYLARSPGSSGAMQARTLANREALNRAGASAMGQTANDLGEGTFSAAKNAIGSEFQRLQGVTAPQLGNDFLNSVAQVDAANAARGSFRNAKIDKLVDQSLDLAVQGKLTGTAYKEIRSELSSKATEAFKGGDATLGQAFRAVRGALDDAAEASLNAADKKAWQTTREQWKAYKTLTKSNVAEGGNVSAARLAGAVRGEGDALRTGAARGPLADIARVGESVKGVPNPTSGQLTQMQQYPSLTGLLLAGGNKATEAVYNGRAPFTGWVPGYLSRGLLDVGPNGQALLEAAGRPGGVLALKRYLGVE